MKVLKFDKINGLYEFELCEISSLEHAHPAIEVLSAVSGSFTLETNDFCGENLTFAVVDANQLHRVDSECELLRILMFECYDSKFLEGLKTCHISLKNGLFWSKDTELGNQIFEQIGQNIRHNHLDQTMDPRIKNAIAYLKKSDLHCKDVISSLCSEVLLSESRLSHVFKKEVGTSIKNYFVWNQLCKAFELYLKGGLNLTEIALRTGFYDLAHMSSAFKRFLGMSPSAVYNSRIVQT